MSKNEKISKIRLGKKRKVEDPKPTEYRLFSLDSDFAANTKVSSISFYTLESGPQAPVYMKLILTVPTDSVLPYDPNPIPNPLNKRCFPIFVPASDICPTNGVNVISSAVQSSMNVASTHTQLEIHLDSGGKVPGGVGFYSE